jgi:dTDP-4-dehydrorhamnose 3,5-epimerase-like enzyme
MDIQATAIPDVKLITPARYGDHRGFFSVKGKVALVVYPPLTGITSG